MTEQRPLDDEELSIPAGYVADLFDLTGRVVVVTGTRRIARSVRLVGH